jgi:hypothetical protein
MDGSKFPIGTWKGFQHFPPDETQIRKWYSASDLTGYGLVTGKVSGYLELVDFDDLPTYAAFRQMAIATGLGDLVDRIEAGYSEETPKPGIHWLYRCQKIAGNTKLASRHKTPEEMKHPKDWTQVLIETRGEGGFAVVAPSHGKTHPSGKPYQLRSGSFSSIATITPDERRDLFTLARTFHVAPAAAADQAKKENARKHGSTAGSNWQIRPGDDFNAKADWRELLEAQGWTFVNTQGERTYWRRPGKDRGISACTNWEGKDYFYCFSTSTDLEPEKPIDKMGFHARTMHGGDFKAAIKALAKAGYGISNKPSKPHPSPAGDDQEAETHPPQQSAYSNTPKGTFWNKSNEWVFLANFTARIVAEVVIDDGAERKRMMEITGELESGFLPVAKIPCGQFSSMNWVGSEWGSIAQIAPGFNIKDQLRYAIQVLSPAIHYQTIYKHTGWREFEGQWVYLTQGAVIAANGVHSGIDVALEGTLNDYALTLPVCPVVAIKASLQFLECAPPEIAFPLFLSVYRALFCEALPVDFSPFLSGVTGSRKTEIAALVQAHYGSRWHGKHLPASWTSTANSLERSAFQAKDAVMVIDDFCPNGTTTDIARFHKDADRVLRAQGNLAGRQRMNPDGSLRPVYFPRGLIIATGEDTPRGQSLRGRLLILEFTAETVNLPALTTMQEHAASGRLAEAAGCFCQWLAPQMTALKKQLPQRRNQLRTEIHATAHSRHPDTLAGLMIAAELFAEFAAAQGVILPAEWLVQSTAALMQAGKDQHQAIAADEPAARFVRLIIAALAAGRCHLKPLDGKPLPIDADFTGYGWQLKTMGLGGNERTDWHECGQAIGRFRRGDMGGVYLDPETSYALAQRIAEEQGHAIPLQQRSLYKALLAKGYLLSRNDPHFTLKMKLPDGGSKRFLHLRVSDKNNGNYGNYGNQGNQPNDFQNEKPVPTHENLYK